MEKWDVYLKSGTSGNHSITPHMKSWMNICLTLYNLQNVLAPVSDFSGCATHR